MSLANASFRAVGVVSLFCDFFLTSVDRVRGGRRPRDTP
jgi:hypothetical protein